MILRTLNSNSSGSEYYENLEENLDFYICGTVDFPKSGIDCSTRNASICFRCEYQNVYFSGESINDVQSSGHLICRILAVVISVSALSGLITNGLTIRIMQKRSVKRSFDYLLCVLSCVDIFCCLGCISYSVAHISYYDNLFGRGMGTMYWLFHSGASVVMWRCVSMYLTMLIVFERYLAIACPLRSRKWYSLGKTKLQAVFIILLISIVMLPGHFRLFLGPNIYGSQDGGLDVPSLRNFQYTFLPTGLDIFAESTIALSPFIYLFQYWIPVPALCIFHMLTYKKVKDWIRKRTQLSQSQKKEVQPARMFFPVVVVFMCTNIWPVIMIFSLNIWKVNYKEVYMSFFLATAVNSSVNFWIYYFRGTAFRTEARIFLSNWSTN